MKIDSEKQDKFNQYLDETIVSGDVDSHPFMQFDYSEIVVHPKWGTGIVCGFNQADFKRDFAGLGVQFVVGGVMTEYRIFTPSESAVLKGTGIVFEIKKHTGLTLEEIISRAAERSDGSMAE